MTPWRLILLLACWANPYTLVQYACEDTELYINCGEYSTIRIVDAIYGRLDNSICSLPQLGIPNANCRLNTSCILQKWFALQYLGAFSKPYRGMSLHVIFVLAN